MHNRSAPCRPICERLAHARLLQPLVTRAEAGPARTDSGARCLSATRRMTYRAPRPPCRAGPRAESLARCSQLAIWPGQPGARPRMTYSPWQPRRAGPRQPPCGRRPPRARLARQPPSGLRPPRPRLARQPTCARLPPCARRPCRAWRNPRPGLAQRPSCARRPPCAHARLRTRLCPRCTSGDAS
jgi:hypothetical protein